MSNRVSNTPLVCLIATAAIGLLAQVSDGPRNVLLAASERVAGAPQQPAGPVSRVYLVRVKPGMDAQWLEGAKKHVEWHRQQRDSWAWTGFYVETGKNTGMYGWISQGHAWADLDKYDATIGKGDSENAMATMGPYEEYHTSGLSVALADLSSPPAAGAQFSLVNVEHFTIHPLKRDQFMGAIAKAHGALQKGGFTKPYLWSMQVSGSEGLRFTLALPMAGWADMAENPAVQKMMAEHLGAEGLASMMRDFYDAVITSETWTARILPDLSYTPGG